MYQIPSIDEEQSFIVCVILLKNGVCKEIFQRGGIKLHNLDTIKIVVQVMNASQLTRTVDILLVCPVQKYKYIVLIIISAAH